MPINTKTETTDYKSNIQTYLCLSKFGSNCPLYPAHRSAAVHAMNVSCVGHRLLLVSNTLRLQPLSSSCQSLRPQPAHSACARVPHHSQQQLRNYSIPFHLPMSNSLQTSLINACNLMEWVHTVTYKVGNIQSSFAAWTRDGCQVRMRCSAT